VGRIQWRRKSLLGSVILFLKACVWPVAMLPTLLICWWVYQQDSVRIGGRSRWGQLWDLLQFSYCWCFAPMEYYSRRMYLENLSDVMPDFLSHVEVKILNSAVNVHEDNETLKNKERFEKHCREHDLPIVPVLATAADGRLLAREGRRLSELPKQSLYYKPVLGHKGFGIERWEYDSTSEQWRSDAQVMDAAGL
ncbi:MAG: hypothetical protein ACPGES_12135, partial [Coraliomargarita sp.]